MGHWIQMWTHVMESLLHQYHVNINDLTIYRMSLSLSLQSLYMRFFSNFIEISVRSWTRSDRANSTVQINMLESWEVWGISCSSASVSPTTHTAPRPWQCSLRRSVITEGMGACDQYFQWDNAHPPSSSVCPCLISSAANRLSSDCHHRGFRGALAVFDLTDRIIYKWNENVPQTE